MFGAIISAGVLAPFVVLLATVSMAMLKTMVQFVRNVATMTRPEGWYQTIQPPMLALKNVLALSLGNDLKISISLTAILLCAVVIAVLAAAMTLSQPTPVYVINEPVDDDSQRRKNKQN